MILHEKPVTMLRHAYKINDVVITINKFDR